MNDPILQSVVNRVNNLDKPIPWVYDDGGRKAAGFQGRTGDCVTRSVSIATGIPYTEVYKTFYALAQDPPRRYQEKTKEMLRRNPSPRAGVYKRIWKPYLEDLGWIWVPIMGKGTGCKVHLKADELPGGVIICRLSKHLCTVIDGILHDTNDHSRGGTRCVYGYFKPGIFDQEEHLGIPRSQS